MTMLMPGKYFTLMLPVNSKILLNTN